MAIIESLESRRFLSATISPFATPAQIAESIATLKADEAGTVPDAKAFQATIVKDDTAIKNDLNHLGVAKTQKALLLAATNGAQAVGNGILKLAKTDTAVIKKEAARLIADETKLAKKPSSSALQAKVMADSAPLTASSNSEDDAFFSEAQKAFALTIGGSFDKIASANPSSTQVAADVSKAKADLNAVLSSNGHLKSLLESDVIDLQSVYGVD